MNKKPKVVNIAFQTKILRKAQTRCTQVEDNKQDEEISLEGFMRSKESTKLMYELLNIIKAQPMTVKQIIKTLSTSSKISSSQSSQLFIEQTNNNDSQLQTVILPQNQSFNQQAISNEQSIDQEISKTNTIYVPKDETDSINQQNIPQRQGKKHLSAFSPIQNKSQQNSRQCNKRNSNKYQQTFYLIPYKYQQNLHFLLTHFLKFKIFNTSKQNTLGKSTITKRPKTTSKNIQYSKTQKITSPQNKPSTAISQNRTLNYKHIQTLPSANFTEDFNQHLQKLILMQKEIQKKSRRINFLQNQLLSCSQTIKEKNNQIRQLQQKQNCLKKKFSYEINRIMKGKVLTDINQLFLSNLNQQNNYGKSIFQINGKKYVKSDEIPCFTQSTFMTTPKMSMFSRSNQSNFRSLDKSQTDMLKKSQSTTLVRKSKGANKKLQMLKLNKQIESLQKQVQKFEQQKSQMFDKLAQNNSKIEKYIEKIQSQIKQKKLQIEKFTQEVEKLKQP